MARERLVVQVEDARRAAAVAAVFQFGLDRRGRTGIVDGRISGSLVRQTLDNIRDVLAALGGQMRDVISLVHYATDIDTFMQTGDIRGTYFAEPYPVTTTVQVERLYHPDLLIEIAAIAEILLARFRRPETAA
ncbi:RidA family protein [Burkholderia sp. NRF60-BP8]|uniref:RidA family protein n=1 Tax=Burkholderia sp. NRF60-BP8 TaxID=1637853 RepID=UPI0009EC294A|nr:RidA family protein [Burkholderia sp. NRF60-BP8]